MELRSTSSKLESGRQASDRSATKHKSYCLCGICHVKSGTIIIGLMEVLLIAHSLIYICSNLAEDSINYNRTNSVFAAVIHYDYLLPLMIVQCIWIISIFVMLIGIKALNHVLILPHLMCQMVTVVTGIVFTTLFVKNCFEAPELTWELFLAISIFTSISLIEVYFSIVVYKCFKVAVQ